MSVIVLIILLDLLCRFFTSVLQINCFQLTFIFYLLSRTNKVIMCDLMTQCALQQQIRVF